MKYLDEYRDANATASLVAEIGAAVTRPHVVMEVCGGQTHSILRYGLDRLLPPQIELVHGPGCPVCVTALETIDRAHTIAQRGDVIFTSFGDMLRVPGSHTDLLALRARGADVRVVYSPLDALALARSNADKRVVFFGIGFETTAPANAMAVLAAARDHVDNFAMLASHVLVPPSIASILQAPDNRVQGFLGPGHVCAITGVHAYESLAARYRVPIAITGLVFVDFCETMVAQTNPSLLARAERTPARHSAIHGKRTIADIMRAFNPFSGDYYREALVMSRLTREMFCLMEGRHVHPSTLYPGGTGTIATPQVFTDYLAKLIQFIDFAKKVVPLNDDIFDFFLEALPGYDKVGDRRVQLGCWGSFQNPDICDYRYDHMTDWGRAMYVTPGIIVDGKLVTTSLVDINVGIRILLGSSYYDDWQSEEVFVERDPLGNPIDRRHPWNQTTIPKPQKRELEGGNYSWVMSPRWLDKRTGDHLALDTGGGPLARLWATALAGLVKTPFVRSTGRSVVIHLPRTKSSGEMELEWKIPARANTIERDRARAYFIAYAAAMALYFVDKALERVHQGDVKVFEEFDVPDEAIGCGFHEAVRGVLSHHLVIRDGKIANYHPYPPTPWNASPRDIYGTPGPYEDAVQGMPIFEENGQDNFKGIDIMRTVRSFDPCLPCGVHMYLGNGKVIQQRHAPMFGTGGHDDESK